MAKRYYWLKLKDDFFSSKRIKKLRNMAGGDTYTIIYLKMQLMAMKTDGVLTWTGLEDSFADELALDLDERPDDVSVTLMYLLQVGLAETQDNKTFYFPWAVENTGSETAAAQRMRDMRERNNVTPKLRERYVEKEIEKESEIEIEKERVYTRTREDEKDDGFTTFWDAYPRKAGDIKGAYMEYLHALDTGATPEMLLEALTWQSDEWKQDGEARYIPSPEKWLTNRKWLDKKSDRPKKTVNPNKVKASCDASENAGEDLARITAMMEGGLL